VLRNCKLKIANSPRTWIHIITILFVFSYIAFDILDLDLSEFPLQQVSHKQVVILAEAPSATELDYFLDHDSRLIQSPVLDLSNSKESIRLQDHRLLRIPSLRLVHSHILRIVFPHSSSSDSSPAA